MTAYNIVRFRVKPGREEEFVDAHRNFAAEGFPGMRRVSLVDTGGGTYCVLGEWESFDDIVSARPSMISTLEVLREMLDELSPELGVTDPVSGHAVVELSNAPRASAKRKPAKKKTAKKAKPAAKKKAAVKPSKKAAKKPAKKAAKKKTAKRRR